LARQRIASSGFLASILTIGEFSIVALCLAFRENAFSGRNSSAIASGLCYADTLRASINFSEVYTSTIVDSARISISFKVGDIREQFSVSGGFSRRIDDNINWWQNFTWWQWEVKGDRSAGCDVCITVAKEFGCSTSFGASCDIVVSTASGGGVCTVTAFSDRTNEAFARINGTSNSGTSISASRDIEVEAIWLALAGVQTAIPGCLSFTVASS